MLILTRKVGERIIINGDIIIEVTRVGDNFVKLGISAPQDVPVDREEVHKLKQTLEKKP